MYGLLAYVRKLRSPQGTQDKMNSSSDEEDESKTSVQPDCNQHVKEIELASIDEGTESEKATIGTPVEDSPNASSEAARAERQAHIHRKAQKYMSSFPGRDKSAANTALHGFVRPWIKSCKKLTDMQLKVLDLYLDYRLRNMQRASDWAAILGLDAPKCEEWNKRAVRVSDDEYKAFCSISNKLSRWPLFEEPRPGEGCEFAKGKDYLAYFICEAGWSKRRLFNKLRAHINEAEVVQAYIDKHRPSKLDDT